MRYFLFSLLAVGLMAVSSLAAVAAEPLVRPGDRVVLLGGALMERMQTHGYLELLLASSETDQPITLRNLGWSGDTVWGDARSVFGSRADGFKRLADDLKEARPTVILAAYGANEAQEGEAKLAEFTAGLKQLLATLEETSARIVLLVPPYRENLGSPLPDQREYNANLDLYAAALEEAAKERGHAVVDLRFLTQHDSAAAVPPAKRLTDNGVHFTQAGYWLAAPQIAARLGVKAPQWNVALHAKGNAEKEIGAAVSAVKTEEGKLSFTVVDEMLPYPVAPKTASPEFASAIASRMLSIAGLAPGSYDIRIDGQAVARATQAELEKGIALTQGHEFVQAEKLREFLAKKNELYFHQYRPQNETYLFLFRKHEQGNNAAEIPQFAPIIAELEIEIGKFASPLPHRYEIERTK